MNFKQIFQQNTDLDSKVLLIEVTSGKRIILDPLPAHFHVGGEITFGETGENDIPRAFYFLEKHGQVVLKKGSIAPDLACLLFGKEWDEDVQVQPEVEYLLQLNDLLFVFRYATGSWSWADRLDVERWQLFDFNRDVQVVEDNFEGLLNYLRDEDPDENTHGVCIEGLEGTFTLRQLKRMPNFRSSGMVSADPEPDGVEGFEFSPPKEETSLELTPDRNGPFVSPYCWDYFSYGDIYHISMDERLIGDPILGSNDFLRFLATRFDKESNAIDAYGNSCSEIADPYTRQRLPQGFLELPQYIYSIVGAPGSGKSNYLSVLINSLQNSLFQFFNMVLKDSDPAHNAPLNDMKNCLFGGGSIEQAALLKTQLEGKMYMNVQRGDRMMSYPRPFIYTLSQSESHESLCNLVFYDNAGEHFEPGIETAISPGAQHIAAAETIFFLVDPTTLPAFRQRLMFHPDPQLKQQGRIDQQDVLLSELEVRLRKTLGLSMNEKIQKPLAILLGKSDIWMSLLDRSQFKNPIEGNILSQEALTHNSNLVRQLLLDLAPNIVANAESISSLVHYFPVSSFGHSPTRLPSGSLAPNPARLKPYLIEVPTLWALSQRHPNAFKVRPKPPSSRLIPNNQGAKLIPEN